MLMTDLNVDELVIIFANCSEVDHKNISKVCTLFERVIEEHFYEKKVRNMLMVSHIKNYPDLFERTLGDMKYADRLRINQNWTSGTCQQTVFFQHRENYETILELDYNHLYTASLGVLKIFKRRRKNGLNSVPLYTIGAESSSRISSLKRRGGTVAGSKQNGTLFTYDQDNGYGEEHVRTSSDQLNDMHFMDDFFVTVSRSDISFYRKSIELGIPTFDLARSLSIGFNSINFNPDGDKILTTKSDSLHILDPKAPTITNSYLNRTQVFNTKWLDNNSFVFTSYGSPLTLIDTRTEFRRNEFSCGTCANFTATCMNYDGRYGLIYGTLLGMMVLLDLRSLRTFERVFHLVASSVCRHIISDEAHLWVATDNAVHLLNFDY